MEKRIQEDSIAVYASDTTDDMKQCGPTTVKRCKRALDLILIGDYRTREYSVYLGAGIRPGYPNTEPLKQLMECWFVSALQERGYYRAHHGDEMVLTNGLTTVRFIRAEIQAWNTFRETQEIVAELRRRNHSGNVWIVSSASHEKRIRLIWKFFPEFIPKSFMTVESVPNSEFVLEAIKMVKVLMLGAALKFKNLVLS